MAGGRWTVGMESNVPSNQNEVWTDEKHVHFLNAMEAWFVRTMLENDDPYSLRLDRDLPDSCESTLDCKPNIDRQRKKHATSTSAFIGTSRSRKMKSRPQKRSRRPPPRPTTPSHDDQSQPYDSSHDQVVPQIEKQTEAKDEKERPS